MSNTDVQQDFQDILFRAPTSTELSSWSAYETLNGGSNAVLAQAIANSNEAQNFVLPIVRLYEAALGRSGLDSDGQTSGLTYWVQQAEAGANLAGGSISAGVMLNMAQQFLASSEFQTRYGSSTPDATAFITLLYQNVLGRLPDVGGQQYWANYLAANHNSADAYAQVLVNFAQSAEFASDTSAAISTWLANAAVSGSYGDLTTTPVQTGQTYTLTADTDVKTGTAGNDTFTGTGSTLTTGDSLNGGAGSDTLNVVVSDASVSPVVDLNSIETVAIRNADTAALSIDAGTWVGVSTIENLRSTGVIAVTGLQNNVTVALDHSASDVSVSFAANALASKTATLTVTADTIGDTTVTATTAGNDYIAKLSVTSTGDNGVLTFGNMTGTDKLTEIDVQGSGDITIAVNTDDAGNIATLNAASMTGGLTIDLSDSTKDVTATTGSGDDALTFGAGNNVINAGDGKNTVTVGDGDNTITTGSGNDIITIGTGNNTVNAGAGDDRVVIGASSNITTDDSINGGDGTDTLVITDAVLDGTVKTNLSHGVSGFEILATTATDPVSVNFHALSIFDTVQIEGADGGAAAVAGQAGAASITVTGMENSDTLVVLANHTGQAGGTATVDGFDGGAGISVTPYVDGGQNAATIVFHDDVTITGGDGSARDTGTVDGNGGAAISAAQIETLNISLVGTDTTASTVTFTGGAAGGSTGTNGAGIVVDSNAVINITDSLSGDGTKYASIDLGTVSGQNVTINAGTLHGAVTVTARDGNVSITTGAGDDVVTTGTGIDTINTGAGNDHITSSTGADQLTGGAGRDAFTMSANGTTAYATITDFGVVTTATTASQTAAMSTISAFQAAATAKGGADVDLLDLTGTPTIASHASTDVTGSVSGTTDLHAAVSTGGIMTLSGADVGSVDTLAEWVAIAQAIDTTSGQAVAFQFGSDTYVYQENGATDTLVKLAGVQDVGHLVVAGGSHAAAAGDIFIG